jgi:hypothetical protein
LRLTLGGDSIQLMRESRWAVKLAALVVVATLVGFCLAAIARAPMSAHGPAATDCMARLCLEATCKTTAAAVHALPVATLARIAPVELPVPSLSLSPAGEPGIPPDRPVSPLAPRSPPLA